MVSHKLTTAHSMLFHDRGTGAAEIGKEAARLEAQAKSLRDRAARLLSDAVAAVLEGVPGAPPTTELVTVVGGPDGAPAELTWAVPPPVPTAPPLVKECST